MKEIKIETEFIKLDQLLKFAGITDTGGQSKIIINDGLVKVNGEVINARGKKIKKGDIIEIKDMESFIVI
ncbi:MAG: RNA-binding S4 domain-containing protein [Tissierellia bacterium]|nr:RNA-binding S4 domain-containing protein [Tissierellia bacterium]